MCVWFAGTQEGIADISVWGSRLPAGGMQWSDAAKLSHDDTRSEQNPVLFLAPDNVLWLLWTAQISGNQDTAIVRYRKSDDLGQTWGEIATLLDKPGTFIRQPITVLDNGNWLLPVFYCRTQPGEKWVGNDDISAVKISADGGHSWRDVEVPQSLGWQPEGCRWFCSLGTSDTQPAELRHTEYHHLWADIQVVITGCEGINAGTRPIARENDEERKPDLFIAPSPENSVAITLHAGDFAVFMPEEPHQALCAIGTATSIRKAVFKVPRDMLEA
nr:YhcH/YjgK/YiaL family protein [Escherichia coli]